MSRAFCIVIERAATFGWERFIGVAGRAIGMGAFGAPAPLKGFQMKLGFAPDRVVSIATGLVERG